MKYEWLMHDFFPCHSADVTTNAPKWAHCLMQQLVSPLASPVWTWDSIPSRMWATCLFCPLLCPHLLEESLSSLGTGYFWINEHMNIMNFNPPSLWQSPNSRCFIPLAVLFYPFSAFYHQVTVIISCQKNVSLTFLLMEVLSHE